MILCSSRVYTRQLGFFRLSRQLFVHFDTSSHVFFLLCLGLQGHSVALRRSQGITPGQCHRQWNTRSEIRYLNFYTLFKRKSASHDNLHLPLTFLSVRCNSRCGTLFRSFRLSWPIAQLKKLPTNLPTCQGSVIEKYFLMMWANQVSEGLWLALIYHLIDHG